MAEHPVVQLDGVSKSFPTRSGTRAVPVLRNVDLTLRSGEKASLVGPSGCGKSTLLSLIAGLLRADEGSIVIEGQELDSLDDRARARLRAERIGIALQSDNLIPFLSARENVELALGFGTTAGRRRRRRRADEMLDRFGVAERAGHRPRHLSGGEAQRVALAVAMANGPALLLADDFALLYVTHDLALADRVARRFRIADDELVER